MRAFLLLSLVLSTTSAAAPPLLLIDGEDGDWADVAVLHADPTGDAAPGRPDFGALSATWDADHLYLRLELGVELSLQTGNEVVLRVDGGGGELAWSFGQRRGTLTRDGATIELHHGDVGLVTAPTVTSDVFEVALDRGARVGGRPLFPGRRLRLALRDGAKGDRLPDEGDVVFEIGSELPPAVEPIALEKHDPAHLRFLSYNTNDHLFDPHRRDAYRRILEAVRPDVVILQEVRSNTSAEVRDYLSPNLGEPPFGDAWHHVQVGGESSVVLSPLPIEGSTSLGDSGAVLLGGGGRLATQVLLVALSTPCCARNQDRQDEIDLIMSFVHDAKTPGGKIDVPSGTPILLIGDANLVGDARQRRTLVEGAIADTERFGPPFGPDWDGSALTDLVPRLTHSNLTYTWVGEDFSPGRLDYVIYSDATVEAANRFVLFTPGMPDEALARHGLERDDTSTATDHLPVVADFAVTPAGLPCIYAPAPSDAEPYPEMTTFDDCAVLGEDGVPRFRPHHLAALDFGERGLAEVWMTRTWYYVLPTGRARAVLTWDNGPDPFAEGLARVRIGGKIAWVDPKLEVVLEPRYDWGWPFDGGLALVCSGCGPGKGDGEHTPIVGGVWGYIDHDGREVVPVRYERDEAVRLRPDP